MMNGFELRNPSTNNIRVISNLATETVDSLSVRSEKTLNANELSKDDSVFELSNIARDSAPDETEMNNQGIFEGNWYRILLSPFYCNII